MPGRLTIVCALIFGLLLPSGSASAQQGGPGTASSTATLTVLAGAVQRVPAGASQPQAATDGLGLAVGDRVLTGPDATALVTFLDGSTLTVQPDSDITVERADVGGGDQGSTINIFINAGTVWARVVRLVDPGSSFSLESNTAIASVHDGEPGAQQNADGSFVCWTKATEMSVQSKQDGAALVLQPGQATTILAGQAPTPRAFAVNQSALRIAVPGNVLPLVQTADKTRVVGFVAPGIEVNQVFGSHAGPGADGGRLIELPAGEAGPFTLVLEGQQDGPFQLDLSGSFQGYQVYQQGLSGTIKKGERLTTQITQSFDPAGPTDPRTARVSGGSVAPLEPLNGPLPGKILLSPSEQQSVGGESPPGG